jgi:hypothetical protein
MAAFIGYAKASCTVEQVREKFEPKYGRVVVEEKIKYDSKGTQFKIFFLHFTNPKILECLPKRMYGWHVQKSNKIEEIQSVEDSELLLLAEEFT